MRLIRPSLIALILVTVVIMGSVAYARPYFDLMAGQAVADVAVAQFAPDLNLNTADVLACQSLRRKYQPNWRGGWAIQDH